MWGGGRLSLAVLGTWNQRQGNRGGNSERETQEEVETGCEGDDGLHCIVSSCVLPLPLSCVLILLNGPLLCQDYKGQVRGHRGHTERRKEISGRSKEKCAVQLIESLESVLSKDSVYKTWNGSKEPDIITFILLS